MKATPIVIPKQHYVNTKEQREDDIPLGFLTPYEDNAAFLKRKDTVDTWARGYYYSNKAPEKREGKYLDNELLEGFQISKHVKRHGWNGGNVVWRIEDPRGFELEIQSANFASIVACTTIIEGVIQGKCIWGRQGAQNVLLPESSEPYQLALAQTERVETIKANKIGAKDVNIGDVIETKNGDHVEYMGTFHYIYQDYEWKSGYPSMCVYTFGNVSKRYLFRDVKTQQYQASSKFEAVRVVEPTKVPKTAGDYLNEVRKLKDSPFHWQTWFISDRPIKKEKIKLEYVPVKFEDVHAHLKRKTRSSESALMYHAVYGPYQIRMDNVGRIRYHTNRVTLHPETFELQQESSYADYDKTVTPVAEYFYWKFSYPE